MTDINEAEASQAEAELLRDVRADAPEVADAAAHGDPKTVASVRARQIDRLDDELRRAIGPVATGYCSGRRPEARSA